MIRLRQIKIEVNKATTENLRKKVMTKLNIKDKDIISFKINKKSLDARKKDLIFYVYEVDLNLKNEDYVLAKIKSKDIFKYEPENYQINVTGTKKLKTPPIIIGSGPAGLFCAYLLSELGYKPLIIERGEKIEDRIKTVEKFFKEGILNPNSNIQFGEGGAGTFSDGKLNTLVKDIKKRGRKVLEIFVENGAPEEILYLHNPHIGTDLLRKVIINMRNKIITMGGKFKYQTTLTDLIISNNQIKQIVVNKNEIIDCSLLILAIGHSARDTYELLKSKQIKMSPKPFAVGLRIMHPQEMINKAQYGTKYNLPPANYKLTYTTKKKRGVYSFCMCPGGYVINASSEKNHLVVNGMSNHNRDSQNSNSAIVVSVSPNDYGNNLLDGIYFQKKLEQKAYQLGQGKIPIQLYGDYKEKRKSTKFGEVKPILKGKYVFANLNELFPQNINDSIIEAIEYYNTKINGFSRYDAILAGVESRTSSPIRIERNDNFQTNIAGIFPIGEGAGYSGGITTSAIDGLKLCEIIATEFKTN